MKLLTFANDHRRIPQWRAGVTFEGKYNSISSYSVNIET